MTKQFSAVFHRFSVKDGRLIWGTRMQGFRDLENEVPVTLEN